MEHDNCIRIQEKQDDSDADSVSSSNSTISYSLEDFKIPVSVKIRRVVTAAMTHYLRVLTQICQLIRHVQLHLNF